MKIKIEFMLKETGECEIFETTLNENAKAHDIVFLKNKTNVDKYAYILGGCQIWKPKGNVICAERVELINLKVEFVFE